MVTDSVSNLVSGILHSLWGNDTTDHDGLVHPWTNVTVMVRKTDEMLSVARMDTRSGFIACVAIFGVLMALVSLAPSVYHIALKVKGEKVRMNEETAPLLNGPENSLLANSMGGVVVNNINQTRVSDSQANGVSGDFTRETQRIPLVRASSNGRPLTRMGLNHSTEVGSML